MKVKMFRMSGNPVDPVKAKQREDDWKSGFDTIIEKHGKHGPETNKELDELEASLLKKYNDLTLIDVELPRTGKAWKELLSTYGNVMATTAVEDNEHAKSGDILLVVNDMPF